MVDSIIKAAPVIRNLPIDTQVLGKAPVDLKQAISTGSIGPILDAQVLQAGATMSQSGYTAQELEQLENLALDLLKQAMSDTVKSALAFDPGAWERYVLVLVKAITALNIARQASAVMNGKLAQMSFEASKAEGRAIMAGGQAAMTAALGGAAVASVMAVGGAGLQIRGHVKQHNDVKFNKMEAAAKRQQATEFRAHQHTEPFKATSGVKPIPVTNESRQGDAMNLDNHNRKLDPGERARIDAPARAMLADAKDATMASDLNQMSIQRDATIGGALNALAHTLSGVVNSTLMVQASVERQRETLHRADKDINKSVSDSAHQAVIEDSAMLAKQLEAMQQLIDSRNSTISAVASARA